MSIEPQAIITVPRVNTPEANQAFAAYARHTLTFCEKECDWWSTATEATLLADDRCTEGKRLARAASEAAAMPVEES